RYARGWIRAPRVRHEARGHGDLQGDDGLRRRSLGVPAGHHSVPAWRADEYGRRGLRLAGQSERSRAPDLAAHSNFLTLSIATFVSATSMISAARPGTRSTRPSSTEV